MQSIEEKGYLIVVVAVDKLLSLVINLIIFDFIGENFLVREDIIISS